MTHPTYQHRLRQRDNWGYLVSAAFLMLLTLGSFGRAEEYQFQFPAGGDCSDPRWDWANPKLWQHGAKLPGTPATAADVAVVPAGHGLAVWKPLGSDKDRPSVRVEEGGTLYMWLDMVNPLTLAGGEVDGAWMGKWLNCPITVTADSRLVTRDVAFGMQLHVNGPVSNSSPVTLHFCGGIDWRSSSAKTFTGNIDIDRGNLYVNSPAGSSALGTGPVKLEPLTRALLWMGAADQHFHWSNDVSGVGTIDAGEGFPQQLLVVEGATIHPGLPDHAGALAVGGALDFQRGSAGQPAQLVIDVQGDGSDINADYGQLAVSAGVTDSLGNVDLILQLKSDMTADQAARLHLLVLTASTPDPLKMNPKPFHSVQVTAGRRKGSATATRKPDPVTGGMVVEVTGITLK